MKYSQVQEGQVFYIEDSKAYPKLKIGMGHKDLRDGCVRLVGNPDWEVELVPDTVVELVYFRESGKYYTTAQVTVGPEHDWFQLQGMVQAILRSPNIQNPGLSTHIWDGSILITPQREDLKVPFLYHGKIIQP